MQDIYVVGVGMTPFGKFRTKTIKDMVVAVEISGSKATIEDFEILGKQFLLANLKVRDSSLREEDLLFPANRMP